MGDILKLVGQRIRDIRKERGLSQEELGEKAGFHFSYIGGVERAEKNISVLNLQKIANALDVNVYDLLLYEGYSHTKLPITNKELLIQEIEEFLLTLKNDELKKVKIFITEFIKD